MNNQTSLPKTDTVEQLPDEGLDAMIFSEFHIAWADHCGLEPEDENAIYGWAAQRDIFLAGWNANESEARRLLEAIVAQYDAAPDGPLGKGFTNGPFLLARQFLSSPNAEVSHGDRERQPDTHSTHKQP